MKKLYALVVCLLVTGLVFGSFGCAAPKEEVGPIVLKAVSTWEKPLLWNDSLFEFIDRVNERAAGRLKIEWVGGPEVAPIFEAADPVGRGVFHVWRTATTFAAAVGPELVALDMAPASWEAKVNTGAVELLDEILREKTNLTILGALGQGIQYHVYLKEPISKADLTGRKLRTLPVMEGLITGLDAATTTIAPADLYLALERGVVDGFSWPSIGIKERKFHEVVNYIVFPGYYEVQMLVLMHAPTLDGLPEDLRKLVKDTCREMEVEASDYMSNLARQELEFMKSAGMEVIELPPEEAKKFLELASSRGWETNVIRKSPEYGPRLQEMLMPLTR